MIHVPTVIVECDSCGYKDEIDLQRYDLEGLLEGEIVLEGRIFVQCDPVDGECWYQMDNQIWCNQCYEEYNPNYDERSEALSNAERNRGANGRIEL